MFYRFLVILLLALSFLDLLSLWLLSDFLRGWFITFAVPAVAVGGGLLAWRQWRVIWRRYETKIAPNPMPPDTILQLVLIIVAAIFFVTPGFVSDLIAVLFLFPLTRGVIVFLILQQHVLLQTARMHRKFQENAKNTGDFYDQSTASQDHTTARGNGDDDVIDVEFQKK